MISKPHHRLPACAAGLVLASAIAACSGPSNSAGPLPVAPAQRRVPAPAPTSTEFFSGITANSNPRGISPGPGGMWFTQPGSNQIGRISSSGVVTEFTAPATTVNNIVEGPDGNMWFTQAGADSIGRMTRNGRLHTFPVGNEAYGPWDITVGSDANLWFTFRSPSTNAIGRITTSGAVTLFSNGLSPGDVAVHDVTTGPDGNVWFVEEFGNRIGRITPAGTITEFTNGITANAGLVDITAGPDGNLWFTENSANQIGRITTAGVVTEFSRGITANASPGSIASGGNYVWFTELNDARIGRVNASGRIVEYPIPATLAADLAAGAPHNSLWITDYSGSGIVQLTP